MIKSVSLKESQIPLKNILGLCSSIRIIDIEISIDISIDIGCVQFRLSVRSIRAGDIIQERLHGTSIVCHPLFLQRKMRLLVFHNLNIVNVLDDNGVYIDTVDIDFIDFIDRCEYETYFMGQD